MKELEIEVVLILFWVLALSFPAVNGLGSMSTVAVLYDSGAVCGIVSGTTNPQSIQCFRNGTRFAVLPNISFDGISAGKDIMCGLRSGEGQVLCWASRQGSGEDFRAKRIYNGVPGGPLSDIAVGEDQVCGVRNLTGEVVCWRPFLSPPVSGGVVSVTAGKGFACGISANFSRRVVCWSNDGRGEEAALAAEIQNGFSIAPRMSSLVAGESHVCGVGFAGEILCRGNNSSGQLNSPLGEFSGVALGRNWSCGIRVSNKTAVCWGRGFSGEYPDSTSFEFLVAGDDFACGLTTGNFSVICWGSTRFNPPRIVSLPQIVPGRCTQSSVCQCGTYPGSENLCSANRVICSSCSGQSPPPSPPPVSFPPPSPAPFPPSSNNQRWSTPLLAFMVVGCIGSFCGLVTVIYCIWSGICCCRQKKIHNSVQPTIAGDSASAAPSLLRRQSSLMRMRRSRSGTSTKQLDIGAEEFTFAELSAATDGFSPENKIGAGSFGTVYRGKLADGREVAIKRGELAPKAKKFQEKESAFQSELAFLSRLHHKHLVSLVGYCEEQEERLLVYEYMQNGALYDHLHTRKVLASPIHSWRTRLRIALDAARGIEYLHNYAVPPIIHRDIKSSNILLDARWTARVSDFGLSLKGPDAEGGHLNLTAAGTVGYMDPEYYGLQQLTAKSDVYGFGVVMLEMLTGKRAIHKDEETGMPTSVVDFALAKITANELHEILDKRVGSAQGTEVEAMELFAYTAVHCVNLEGRERPSMTDIVTNLERAVSMFGDSHYSNSSRVSSISI